jgi:acyl-CoA synthetase (AMP-forming)/AMP-acid ligase II
MTKLGGASQLAPDVGPDFPDSIRPALPGVGCRVVDPDTGRDAGPGEPGELWIRSESATRGHLDDPQATAAMIDAGGRVHTGDIVTVDEHGWFRVTDRINELPKAPWGKVLRRLRVEQRLGMRALEGPAATGGAA